MGDLEAKNDVFADIMNVLMFKGKALVSENDLEQGREKSSYDSDQEIRLRPQYRDILQSDFKIVADYLVQMRKSNDYKPAPQEIRHVREVLNAMAALTQDTRFEEVYIEAEQKGDEPKTMSEVLDRVENKGRKAGQLEITKLMAFLAANGRSDDIVKAGKDESFLNKLLIEFNSGLLVAK